MHARITVVALTALCAATVAGAQNPDPLPGRLVGTYAVTTGGNNKINVVPVELTEIKVAEERVSGIVANYRTPNGFCISENTPFNGTYQNGMLSVRSRPLVSQSPDGRPCGPVIINVKFSAGRASGTYKMGPLEGTIDLEAK